MWSSLVVVLEPDCQDAFEVAAIGDQKRINAASNLELAWRACAPQAGGFRQAPAAIAAGDGLWGRRSDRRRANLTPHGSSGSMASAVSFTSTLGQPDASRRTMVNGTPFSVVRGGRGHGSSRLNL
jgi:hypothetical protein